MICPSCDAEVRCQECGDHLAVEALQKVERFEVLFGGGPDTPCRTTYPDGVECVEVPMDDLRRAFDPTYSPVAEGGGDRG